MASKKKGSSTGYPRVHRNEELPGTSRYVTTKNRKNTPDRMELMKYNPILKKMTLHKEIK